MKRNDPHGHLRPFDRGEGRRSIRLKGYDYTQSGAYFVTIVTHEREMLFGDPVLLRVAETMWQRIPHHFPHVELDEWVVMPNHIHGIIVITDAVGATHSANGGPTERAGSQYVTPCSAKQATGNASPLHTSPTSAPSARPTGPPPGSLGAIVGNFKSVTSRRINRIRHTPGVRVWQRNYYEHIIRNERALNRIRQYIRDNPARWAEDRENPNRLGLSESGEGRRIP